jgi:hypothetical protein
MRNLILLAIIATMFSMTGRSVSAQQVTLTTKNTSVKDVMKQAHKKPNELLKKVALGKATKVEQKKLYDLYSIMAKHQPKKGPKSSWAKRTGLLVSSVKAVMDGKSTGPAMLSKASNCTSCHAVHK